MWFGVRSHAVTYIDLEPKQQLVCRKEEKKNASDVWRLDVNPRCYLTMENHQIWKLTRHHRRYTVEDWRKRSCVAHRGPTQSDNLIPRKILTVFLARLYPAGKKRYESMSVENHT